MRQQSGLGKLDRSIQARPQGKTRLEKQVPCLREFVQKDTRDELCVGSQARGGCGCVVCVCVCVWSSPKWPMCKCANPMCDGCGLILLGGAGAGPGSANLQVSLLWLWREYVLERPRTPLKMVSPIPAVWILGRVGCVVHHRKNRRGTGPLGGSAPLSPPPRLSAMESQMESFLSGRARGLPILGISG